LRVGPYIIARHYSYRHRASPGTADTPQRRCYRTDTGARASLRFLNDNAPDKISIVCRRIVAKRQQQPSQNVTAKFDCPLGESSMMPQPFQKFDGSRLHRRPGGRRRGRRYDIILREEVNEETNPTYIALPAYSLSSARFLRMVVVRIKHKRRPA